MKVQYAYCAGNRWVFTDRWNMDGPRYRVTADTRYRTSERGDWLAHMHLDHQLPTQGWKLHVGGLPSDGQAILDILVPHLHDVGASFKHLRGPKDHWGRHYKQAGRSGAAKFVTIYPHDVDEATRMAHDLADLLSQFDGPVILSDLRWRESIVYLRYGAFLGRMLFSEEENRSFEVIENDLGELVEADRVPYFTRPDWAPLNEDLRAMLALHEASDVVLPFEATAALHFSNSGGVFEGRMHGRDVVVKEARRFGGLEPGGRDARDRLRDERANLLRMRGCPGVPELIDFVTVRDHDYLVMEKVDGQKLNSFVAATNPTKRMPDGGVEGREYARRSLAMIERLRQILDFAHEQGLVYGDLSPTNVLIAEDQVWLIDWETAGPIESFRNVVTTPGYSLDNDAAGMDQDRFALWRVALAFFLPLPVVMDIFPGNEERQLAYIGEYYGVEAAERLSHYRAVNPRVAAASPGDDWTQVAVTPATIWKGVAVCRDRLGHDAPMGIGQFEGRGEWNLLDGLAGYVATRIKLGDRDDAAERRLLATARDVDPHDLSFGSGLAGRTLLSAHLDESLAAELLPTLLEGTMRLATAAPSLPFALDSGRAGILLSLAKLREKLPVVPDRLVEVGNVLAQGLVEQSRRFTAGPHLKGGLQHGWSGAAFAVLQWYSDSVSDAASSGVQRMIQLDIDTCRDGNAGELMVWDDFRIMPYLGLGSAGILMAVLHARTRGIETVGREEERRLLRACCSNFYVLGGLYYGRAGIMLTAQLADESLFETDRDVLVAHQRRCLSQTSATLNGGVLPLGDQNLRISFDYMFGGAGIALALSAEPGDTAAWLPF